MSSDQPTGITKMMAVLNCFSASQPKLSATEIAQRTDIPRPTVHRILSGLVDVGLLDQVRRRDNYSLGTAILGLGTNMLAGLELNHVAQPHVEALGLATGETVHLAVFDGVHSVVVNGTDSTPTNGLRTFVLKTSLANACSTGKAALAFQPPEAIERFIGLGLRKIAPKTISDPDTFRRELEITRSRGWAIDEEESGPGMRCIGAPIRNAAGRVFAALSVSGRKVEIEDDKIEPFAHLVTHYANAISFDLGYSV